MTSTAVLNLEGKQIASITLAEAVFAGSKESNIPTMHSALIRQLSNTRAGSANTKTRAEVRGGGAKPWRQKGTGRARAGSRRSPLWAGGGIIFGPKPRDFGVTMPAKMRRNAIKSALAAKVKELVIVDSFADIKESKTKAVCQVLKNLQLSEKKLLVVVEKNTDKSFALAARNIKNVTLVHSNNLGVKELLDCEAILTSQATIENITKWLAPAEGAPTKEVRTKEKTTKAQKEAKPNEVKANQTQSTKVKTTEVKNTAIKTEASKPKAEKDNSALRSIANTSASSKTDTAETVTSKQEPKAETKPKKKEDNAAAKKDKGKGK